MYLYSYSAAGGTEVQERAGNQQASHQEDTWSVAWFHEEAARSRVLKQVMLLYYVVSFETTCSASSKILKRPL